MQPPAQTHHDDMQPYRNLWASHIAAFIHDALYEGSSAPGREAQKKADYLLRRVPKHWQNACEAIGLDAFDLRDRYLRGDLTADDFWSATHTRGRAA